MRCPRCGNDSPDGNRFCGMCGATLLPAAPIPPVRAATPVPAERVTAPNSVPRQPAPEPPRPATRASDETPPISGPSFLGLNDPPPRKRASLSIDPHSSHGSRNLDYLLDDEEEHKSGGGGKFFLILLALVLAAGFGYWYFRMHGFPWVNAGASKPPVVAQNPSATDTNSATPAPSSITPEPQPAQPAPSQPAPAQSQPPADANPSHGTIDANTPAPESKAETPPADATASSNKPADTATKPAEPAPADKDAASTEEKEPAAAVPPKSTAKPKPAAHERASKPSAATRSADPVAEAQKYLYGRGGEAQDCDRGLRLLKPLANQGNSKAMIEMGALYSAGLCTPRDLPTSYRWFAIALRKDPSNDAIQTDLQKLWSEMTQPERQLAIKLTQ